MLTDDDLTRLLEEAAASYDVPAVDRTELLDGVPEVVPLHRRKGVQLSAVAAALVAGVLLTSSLGGSTLSTKTSADGPRESTPGPAVGAATSGTTDSSLADTQAARRPFSLPAPAGTKALAQAVTDDETRVVKTGTITLMVDKGKVTPTVQRLQGVVTSARGFIANQETQEIGDNPSASVTVRVPVASFEAVITQVRGLGAKVVSVSSSGKDVTAAYADTSAQIASLKAARSRFLTILSGAKTIGETLTVQQRVDEVQGQMDRLEGQRRVLANQSDLATLTVSVNEKAPTELVATERSGFGKAWDDAKHGFSTGVQALIAHSGRALLLLILGVLGLVVVRFGWRLARRRLV